MQDGGMMMNSNVKSVISKCEKNNNGEVFLSLKPRIDDLDTTVAHLYSAGGKMCYFNKRLLYIFVHILPP